MVVSSQKEVSIRKFLKNEKTILAKKGVELPWVVEDSLFKKYFPHWYFSHLIWIYKGTLVAITTGEYVDAKNIQDILDGKTVNLPVKNDVIGFDYKKQSLFKLGITAETEPFPSMYYAVISAYQNGLNSTSGAVIDTMNQTSRLYSTNSTILTAYARAYGKIYSYGVKPGMGVNRLILEVKDPSEFIYKKEYGYRDAWDRKNKICYEASFPLSMDKRACYQQMVNDLDRFLGLHTRWEKRKVPCLVVVQKDTDKEIQEKKKKKAAQYSYYDIDNRLKQGENNNKSDHYLREKYLEDLRSNYRVDVRFKEKALPLINECSYKETIIFPYLRDYGNILSLREALQSCGFDLIEAERETEMFVVTETR
jgi:hypothetical protein